VRDDESPSTVSPPPAVGPRPSVRSYARAWAGPLALGLLGGATSLALAWYASAWLVPPYLVLMALVLGVPPVRIGRPPAPDSMGRPARPAPGTGTVGDSSTAVAGPGNGNGLAADWDRNPHAGPPAEPDSDGPASSVADSSGADPAADLPQAKARRGRGRGRKSKLVTYPVVENAQGMWVKVGPGKFVRADPVTLAPAPTAVPDGPAGGDSSADAPADARSRLLAESGPGRDAGQGVTYCPPTADRASAAVPVRERGPAPGTVGGVVPESADEGSALVGPDPVDAADLGRDRVLTSRRPGGEAPWDLPSHGTGDGAARTAPEPAGATADGPVWPPARILSDADHPPETGAGMVRDAGPGGRADGGHGQGDDAPAGDGPGASVGNPAGDNGIAPDAPARPRPDAPDLAPDVFDRRRDPVGTPAPWPVPDSPPATRTSGIDPVSARTSTACPTDPDSRPGPTLVATDDCPGLRPRSSAATHRASGPGLRGSRPSPLGASARRPAAVAVAGRPRGTSASTGFDPSARRPGTRRVARRRRQPGRPRRLNRAHPPRSPPRIASAARRATLTIPGLTIPSRFAGRQPPWSRFSKLAELNSFVWRRG